VCVYELDYARMPEVKPIFVVRVRLPVNNKDGAS